MGKQKGLQDQPIVSDDNLGVPISKKEASEKLGSELFKEEAFGLDESNTNRQDFWESIADSNFGESQYDTQKLTLRDTDETIQQHRYDLQTKWDKTGNSLVRTATGIGLKTIDGIAFSAAMAANALKGTFDVSKSFDNEVSQKLKETEEIVDKAFPIYKPTNYNELGFYDKIMNTNGSFFFDETAEAFEFIGSTTLSTIAGSGLINLGLKSAKLAATSLKNINTIKKTTDLLNKNSKVFNVNNIGTLSKSAKNLSVFGEAQAAIYKSVNDTANTLLKSNILTKETALNIYNTAVESGIEAHEVAKQYLNTVEENLKSKHLQEREGLLNKLNEAVGKTSEDKEKVLSELDIKQKEETEKVLQEHSLEAKRRANNTFILNAVALYGPNMIQTKALLGSIGSNRNSLLKYGNNLTDIKNNIQKINPSPLKEFGKSYLRNTPSEFGQEVIQKGITDYELSSELHSDTSKGYFESGLTQMFGSVSKAIEGFATQETAETALITAIITSPTSVIDASHRTQAAKGEIKSIIGLLNNADLTYSDYKSDIKSIYKTDSEGKILRDPKTNEDILDQDVINRKIYQQISDFATALETSDAILNNDETKLNLVRNRALGAMVYEYASMGEEGKELALLILDEKAKEASDQGDEEEARFIKSQRSIIESYVDAYSKIEKDEGNNIDLLNPDNINENPDKLRDYVFHKKYKKSLYHQATTRLGIQNVIEENNKKIQENSLNSMVQDSSVVNNLQKQNESLSKAIEESFKISKAIKENYDKIKKEYYSKVDSSIKSQKQIEKLKSENEDLEKEKVSASPERVIEIDSIVENNKNKILGIEQVLNQSAKYSGVYPSETQAKEPFSNIEEVGKEYDYAEKNIKRLKFLDSAFNNARNNTLLEKAKNYKEELKSIDNKINTTQKDLDSLYNIQEEIDGKLKNPNIESVEKDELVQAKDKTLQDINDNTQLLQDLLAKKYAKEDKLNSITIDNPRDRKTFHDYEDLRDLVSDFKEEDLENYDNSKLKEDIKSVVDDFGNFLSSNPIADYDTLLNRIDLVNISEEDIIDNIKNITKNFKDYIKFVSSSYPMDELEYFEESFSDINRIVGNLKLLNDYTVKVKNDSKYNVPYNQLEDLLVKLDHEQLISMTEDYSLKSKNNNIDNKDFVDVAGLTTLKNNLIASIESLKLPERSKFLSNIEYLGGDKKKGIIQKLEESLKATKNLLNLAKNNLANRELRQEEIGREYSFKQIKELLKEGSLLQETISKNFPDYKNIIDSDPVNGIFILWEKIRTSDNTKAISEIKKSLKQHKDNYNLLINPYLTTLGELRREILRDAYNLSTALELGNLKYSWELKRLAENLKINNPELNKIINILESGETLDTISKYIETDYSFSTALSSELSIVEGSQFAPSHEQLIAIRELLMALSSNKFDVSYLQGSAGTGKTSVVLPTVLKTAKKLGIYTSDTEIYSFGHTDKTTDNLVNNTSGIKGSFKDFLELDLQEFDKYSIITIDEFPMLDVNVYLKKIQTIQTDRKEKDLKPLKIITLGDYNQNILNTFTPLATLKIKDSINLINPLTIKYRSNNEAINNLSDFFEHANTNIEKITGASTNVLGIEGIQGTMVTNNLQDLFVQIKADENNSSKAIIIASHIPSEIEKYKKELSGLNIDVLSTAEAQGLTFERVYTIGSNKTDLYTNTSIYTAISRASQFSMLYMPTVLEYENFNNPSDAEYLNKLQEERDKQIKESKTKYIESINNLGALLDEFDIKSDYKKENEIPVLEETEDSDIEEIEIIEDPIESEEVVLENSKGGIVVTYPESSQIKSGNFKQGDKVIVRKLSDGGYRVIHTDSRSVLGYINKTDLPSAIVEKLDIEESIELEIDSSKHIDFLYKSNTNDKGENLILDKIQTFIDGVYPVNEQKPLAKDILENSSFTIVTMNSDNIGFKRGTIKLTLNVPGKSKGRLALNFNQINSKDYIGENSISKKIKDIQDFKDKVLKLNSLLGPIGQYGNPGFSTLINTASNNLKISYDENNIPFLEIKPIKLSEEEFKLMFQNLTQNTVLKTSLNQILVGDLQEVMNISTDIALMYYGVKKATVNYLKLDQQVKDYENRGVLSEYVSTLDPYNKRKYEMYIKHLDSGYKLDNTGVFINNEGSQIKNDVLDAGQGVAQRSFSTIVLSSLNDLEEGSLKYSYSKFIKSANKNQIIALPLISTTQNILVLEAKSYAKNNNITEDINTPQEAYDFLKKEVKDKNYLDRIEQKYDQTTNKDYQSIGLNHIDGILTTYNTKGIRIPTTRNDIKEANKSLENKIALGKKLTSNFIGVVPTTLTLRLPNSSDLIVTTPTESISEPSEYKSEYNLDKSRNISNLLDNSENFNCD